MKNVIRKLSFGRNQDHYKLKVSTNYSKDCIVESAYYLP